MAVQTRKLGDSYWCPKCRVYKIRESFGVNKSRRYGISGWCKECSRRASRKYPSARVGFWERFKKRVREENGCSVWTGACINGYPVIRWEKKQVYVRRIVYQLSRADVPGDMFVEMTCGNNLCVKQSHMRLISEQTMRVKLENNALFGESWHRVRHRGRGGQRGPTKLTTGDVLAVRQRYAAKGSTYQSLAREYGVSASTIGRIIHRKTWAHVPDPEESSDA